MCRRPTAPVPVGKGWSRQAGSEPGPFQRYLLTIEKREQPELIVRDAAAWRRWLGAHHVKSNGVWLVLAKKATVKPTRLVYPDALEEALAYGWIDGQMKPRDESTYRQRFTPRRRRSAWSKRNTEIVERLIQNGRMHAAGIAEIDRAKQDGRWQGAYERASRIEVPNDLAAALEAEPVAKAMFGILTQLNRYAILFRIHAARRPETRARRIQQFVAMLARRETPHPQKRQLSR